MKKQIIISIILIGSIFCSCTSDKNEHEFLDKKIKSEAKPLQIDTVGFFEDLIYARDFWVYKDSILIVRNRKNEDVYFLEFYNLSQKQLLKQMFRLGNGPNELLSANVYINEALLTVIDFVKDQAAFVNVDSVLQNPDYTVAPVRYFPHSPVAVQYTEDRILVENPNCFKDDVLGVDHKAPRFIVNEKKTVYVEKNQYKYYTWNVATSGRVITNYQRNKIIYANSNQPEIEVYDNDLNLLKRIQGPDKLPPDYRVVNEFDANEVLFKKGYIPYTYLCYCTDKDFIYLGYMGDYLDLVKDKHMEDYPLWIFKFDWDGSFIDSYSIGRYVSNISLSADGKSFYATAIDEDKNPFLIKLSIK